MFKFHFFFPQDCIPGSLDKSSLTDLLNKTNTNADCIDEARRVFAKQFVDTIIKITGPFSNGDEYAIDESGGQMIEIKNSNSVKAILKAFGDLIKTLAICFDQINADEGKEIISDVSIGCSDTALSALYIENCKETVLNDFTTKFPRVEHVTFSSSSSSNLNIRPDALKLNELFPNLVFLELKHTAASDWAFIGDTFQHLTDLHVELPHFDANQNVIDENIVNLLKMNPDISTLSLSHSSLRFLRKINAVLPQLKALKLTTISNDYSNDDGDAIRFENVKFLTIESDRKDDIPKNIIFVHRLQELKLIIQPEFNENWIAFIGIQLNGSVFFQLKTEMLTDAHLLNVAEKLPNLRKADISCESKMSAFAIMEFLEKSYDLHTLNLDILMDDTEEDDLEQKVYNKWDINHVSFSGNRIKITLERLHQHENGVSSIQASYVWVVAVIFCIFQFY